MKFPLPICIRGEIRDSSDARLESTAAQRCSTGVICRRCQLTMSGRDCVVPAIVQALLLASISSFAEPLGISSELARNDASALTAWGKLREGSLKAMLKS